MPDLITTHNALPLSSLSSHLPTTANHNWPTLLTLHLHTAATAPTSQCFTLVRTNLLDMYRRSSLGWSASAKRKEMRHKALRYLVLLEPAAVSANDNDDDNDDDEWEDDDDGGEGKGAEELVAGFASFMVTEEEGEEVIYVYELQMTERWRGRGLGGRLMEIVEAYGKNVGLQKAMLTVFTENVGAIRLYERAGYSMNEISPKPKRNRRGELREVDYRIMSKELV